jgi:NitT/TauT family transport system ATP-binding protein
MLSDEALSPVLRASTEPDKVEVARFKGVSKAFSNGTVALSGIDFQVGEGEFLSFLGPSGCGKSTIFRLLAGLGRQNSGTISVFGQSPDEARRSQGLSFVFQDATLMPWQTVLDNVSLPLALKKVPRQVRRIEAERVIELVGLGEFHKALPRELSGGMKMRVSIARALISKPRLLLMDEPFGALDELTRQDLHRELLTIRELDPRLTVLFVTHNVFEAVFLSSRILVMTPRPGRIGCEIQISRSYPRSDEFRGSAEYSGYLNKVNSALIRHKGGSPHGDIDAAER